MEQPTRRHDVDTKWMLDVGVEAAKDFIGVEQYHRVQNHLEDKCLKVREPASEFANKILK
jgi:hypothetical protein